MTAIAAPLLAVALLAGDAGGASAAPRAPAEPSRGGVEAPARAAADDPLEFLWSHRLHLAGGKPLVTIRLAEGRSRLAFRVASRARLRARGGGVVEVGPGQLFTVRARDALPAALSWSPLLEEAMPADRDRLAAARRLWEERGVQVRQKLVGGVYGIAGHVVDNRRVLLLADGDGSQAFATAFATSALERHGASTGTFAEIVRRPSGLVEVLGPGGDRVVEGDALVTLEVEGGASFTLVGAEADPGPAVDARRGAEDRSYRGVLHLTLDASGRLAAVLALPLEELLRGIVPSEIPAGSPREALKAQAVTARSNVLAQIGTRHLTDPYVLCSEVHCQAYRGERSHAPSTDAAVRATAGEAIFRRSDRALVDGVYSAVCGGHGEDNDAVWPTLADPSLRGRPDMDPASAERWRGGLQGEQALRRFLAAAPAAWCARATGVPRYRWERRVVAADLDLLTSSLRVGHVRSLEVTSRGASGRARALEVDGEAGRAVVEGELRIRQLLGNLPSAMFVVDRAGEGWTVRGGGWGHGAGMCQWGAIGRAEAGQGYREILGAYFSGADVARLY